MAGSYQRQELEAYAVDAPVVAGWLARAETAALLDAFDRADARALKRQGRYRKAAKGATVCTTIATVIAALFLMGLPLPPWISVIQLAFVLGSVSAVLWISGHRLLDRWMRARALAEEARAGLFSSLVRAELPLGPAGEPALAAQLEAFVACHLASQRGYYKRRSADHAKAAGSVAPLKVLGYTIIFASIVVSIFVGLLTAADLGWIGRSGLIDGLRSLPVSEPHRWQLGLGALASASLSFSAAWTLINQDDRNAARYALTAGKLETETAAGLAAAQTAAGRGDRAGVLLFTDRIQFILDAEHSAWVASRPPGDPNAGPGPSLAPAM